MTPEVPAEYLEGVLPDELRGAMAILVRIVLQKEREALLPLLREAEWSATTWTDYATCPWCHGLRDEDLPAIPGRHEYEPRGHKPDCRFAAAVRTRSSDCGQDGENSP